MPEVPLGGAERVVPEAIDLIRAGPDDLDALSSLVAEYHAFERIDMPEDRRRSALSRLLADRSLGEVWFVHDLEERIGYIAICFGYSIEFAGRDAFIDELFLKETVRGRGIGSLVIREVTTQLASTGIAALHLEVDNHNFGAQRFYERHRFQARRKYHLMSLDLTARQP
ncbi:GNAT family N-acetyltransferase [Denitrobaculum tricleocarpae]|uniref:GNAT family N-acetyltransferase n=1 Tax=Denitrobaculum tricleocarpae TaxID=2591009 RepID=UPI0015D3960B|nr:GNAT family N-acetyltransferase [Denitrobaculum tricleocarpae]